MSATAESAAQAASLKALKAIPGVGPALAQKLRRLGYRAPADLAGQDAEAMYAELIRVEGHHVDRCVLYVFRCAVYYAEHLISGAEPDPDKLKWWRWKD